MKKKIVTMCLVSLSLLGFSKVGLFFFNQEQTEYKTTQLNEGKFDVLLTKQTKPNNDMLLKGGEWLLDEIIPSAEAAKSIPLNEERNVVKQREFSGEMKEKMIALKNKEEELNEREALTNSAEKRASEKIVALEALETRIEALLKQEESIKDKKIKRLTSVYEGMKANKAAPVIAQMELGIVVKMFLRMNEKQVGKILSFLPPQQAVVISQALTKRVASISQ
jgi:flagellar motility protein MotE (MotC chaperone)